jgi:acyl carrier protein
MNQTETTIRQIVAKVAGISSDIPADLNLYLDLGVASVYALQLLMELEERFGVAIPDEDFVEATSIAGLTRLMDKLTEVHPQTEAVRA